MHHWYVLFFGRTGAVPVGGLERAGRGQPPGGRVVHPAAGRRADRRRGAAKTWLVVRTGRRHGAGFPLLRRLASLRSQQPRRQRLAGQILHRVATRREGTAK